jgi:hypothetical protein
MRARSARVAAREQELAPVGERGRGASAPARSTPTRQRARARRPRTDGPPAPASRGSPRMRRSPARYSGPSLSHTVWSGRCRPAPRPASRTTRRRMATEHAAVHVQRRGHGAAHLPRIALNRHDELAHVAARQGLQLLDHVSQPLRRRAIRPRRHAG